ncbi:hypothetical protein [Pontibacillus yanchengensis]|uniref:Membrane protein n=1 Tax=Pontibacillus yanchengensis Y32 TaxID=1385514 RepID=A0A0A2TFC1_9BACI|nr:membrane protein [Pontibacillus yanchengensis Y32]
MNLAWLIVACEIGFWLFIVFGLVTRYIWNKKKLGLFLLALTPVIDIVLLVVTGIDLYYGSKATVIHGLAAVYIGISIGFGKRMIEWADEQFSYYVIKQGPKPKKLFGMQKAVHYFKGWLRHLISYLIGIGLLAGMVLFLRDTNQTEPLVQLGRTWTVILGIDLMITISYFLFPKKEKVRKTSIG